MEAIYSNPTFAVKISSQTSDYYRQLCGSRQRCPLSPYLFFIVMAVMFNDIHLDCDRKPAWARMTGVRFSEILYADDTVLITDEAKAMRSLLETIEKHAKYYRLNLNKKSALYYKGTPMHKSNSGTAKHLARNPELST